MGPVDDVLIQFQNWVEILDYFQPYSMLCLICFDSKVVNCGFGQFCLQGHVGKVNYFFYLYTTQSPSLVKTKFQHSKVRGIRKIHFS